MLTRVCVNVYLYNIDLVANCVKPVQDGFFVAAHRWKG